MPLNERVVERRKALIEVVASTDECMSDNGGGVVPDVLQRFRKGRQLVS